MRMQPLEPTAPIGETRPTSPEPAQSIAAINRAAYKLEKIADRLATDACLADLLFKVQRLEAEVCRLDSLLRDSR